MKLYSRIKDNWTLKMVIVLAMLLSCYPFVFNVMLGLGSESTIMVAFLLILFVLYISSKHSIEIPYFWKVCFLLQGMTWLLYSLIHSDSSYLTRIFMMFLTALSLQVLIRDRNLFCFAKNYNWIITIMAIAGVPIFFLFALGLTQPLQLYTNIDGRQFAYFGLTCSNAFTAGICRVAGFFDEPGAFAFWGIYALILNKIYFNNRKLEILLMISLLSTLSAAYFVQLILYIVLFYASKAKNFIPVAIILGVVVFGTYKYLGENEQLAYLTTERFEGGQIRSARVDMTKQTQKVFAESPIVGIGAKKFLEIGYFDDNPYEIPAKDGIIGFIVTYLPLIYVTIKYSRKDRNILWAGLILFVGYMQRPFHINVLHFFMLYLFVLLAYYKYEKNNIYV